MRDAFWGAQAASLLLPVACQQHLKATKKRTTRLHAAMHLGELPRWDRLAAALPRNQRSAGFAPARPQFAVKLLARAFRHKIDICIWPHRRENRRS